MLSIDTNGLCNLWILKWWDTCIVHKFLNSSKITSIMFCIISSLVLVAASYGCSLAFVTIVEAETYLEPALVGLHSCLDVEI